jgi:hypothetical protein
MPARENYGLQVALILLVMVAVVLSITTYVYFRRSEERLKELQSARAEAQQTRDAWHKTRLEIEVFRHVLGYESKTSAELAAIRQGLDSSPAVDQVWANFEQDMSLGQPTGAPERLDYRRLVGDLFAAVQRRTAQLADANEQVKILQAEKDDLRAVEAKRVAVAQQGQQDAQANLASVQQAFSQSRAQFVDTTNALATKISDKDQEYRQLAADSQTRIEDLTKKREQAWELVKAHRERIRKLEPQTPESPAGTVTAVNEQLKSVWINLGRADGLQGRMTFSVFDQRDRSLTKVKGRLEVTRVTEDHVAEARILQSPLADPILAGDWIASPAFRKGQKTHFALAGLLDIDGDGRSDHARVRALITSNGGVVDAELLEDGTIAGRLTNDTRYLVQGQRPTDRTNVQLTAGYSKLIAEAADLAIEPMTLPKLLERMGYVPGKRVTNFARAGTVGAEAPRNAFPSRNPAGVQ